MIGDLLLTLPPEWNCSTLEVLLERREALAVAGGFEPGAEIVSEMMRSASSQQSDLLAWVWLPLTDDAGITVGALFATALFAVTDELMTAPTPGDEVVLPIGNARRVLERHSIGPIDEPLDILHAAYVVDYAPGRRLLADFQSPNVTLESELVTHFTRIMMSIRRVS